MFAVICFLKKDSYGMNQVTAVKNHLFCKRQLATSLPAGI